MEKKQRVTSEGNEGGTVKHTPSNKQKSSENTEMGKNDKEKKGTAKMHKKESI